MPGFFSRSVYFWFTERAFRKLLSVYVFTYFPFGFEGTMWDLIVSASDQYNSLRLKDELEENLFPMNQGVSARRSANWNNV